MRTTLSIVILALLLLVAGVGAGIFGGMDLCPGCHPSSFGSGMVLCLIVAVGVISFGLAALGPAPRKTEATTPVLISPFVYRPPRTEP